MVRKGLIEMVVGAVLMLGTTGLAVHETVMEDKNYHGSPISYMVAAVYSLDLMERGRKKYDASRVK